MSAHIHIAAKRAFQLGFFAHGNHLNVLFHAEIPASYTDFILSYLAHFVNC